MTNAPTFVPRTSRRRRSPVSPPAADEDSIASRALRGRLAGGGGAASGSGIKVVSNPLGASDLEAKVKALEAQLKENGNTARRKPAAKKVVKASPTPETPVKTVVVAEKSENTPTAA